MKSKGIVIELTALLDVILIMLFWIMMNVQDSSENIRAEADSRVADAEEQIKEAEESVSEAEKRAENAVSEMERMQTELDSVREEAEKEIAEAWKKAASINDNAAANQLALENYENGRLITINLNNSGISISDNNNIFGQTSVISENTIAENLIYSLESADLGQNDVILCAMIYDGSEALYKDVKAVKNAVDEIKSSYTNLYCTYINIKER
ncbi:MAG: hypothetical protein K2I06_01625 [Ruminococcus sp.]|nr:hypothetical protein [Ruminococcus sp.]